MNVICGWNVANSILIKSFNDKIYVTPVKLNCLIYLLYGEYLYTTGDTLFSELFTKTENGPVLTTVYQKFNSYGNKIIKNYAKDAKDKTIYVDNGIFVKCLNYIWDRYKNMSLDDLLLYIETGYTYRNKSMYDTINNIDVLNDMIIKKENELERAREYMKKLKR